MMNKLINALGTMTGTELIMLRKGSEDVKM